MDGAWECLSPLAQRTRSQCIPSSGTSEASERLSLREPLSWRKIHKNSEKVHKVETQEEQGKQQLGKKTLIYWIIIERTSSGISFRQSEPPL